MLAAHINCSRPKSTSHTGAVPVQGEDTFAVVGFLRCAIRTALSVASTWLQEGSCRIGNKDRGLRCNRSCRAGAGQVRQGRFGRTGQVGQARAWGRAGQCLCHQLVGRSAAVG